MIGPPLSVVLGGGFPSFFGCCCFSFPFIFFYFQMCCVSMLFGRFYVSSTNKVCVMNIKVRWLVHVIMYLPEEILYDLKNVMFCILSPLSIIKCKTKCVCFF